MKLTVNMRLGSGSNSFERKEIQDFADWILNIRNDKIGGKNDGEANVEFLDDMLILDSDDHIGSIISETYPDLLQNIYDPDYFQERAILAPTHELVDMIMIECSTSGTHKEKGKNVRMKSSRRINFDDTDDEDEVESQSNPFEGISNDPIFGCESWGALLWHAESSVGNTHSNSESYSLCCGRGKVMLPTALKNPPKLLMDLINRKHAKSTNFIDNIRRYNSMFAFTSMGGKQDKSVNTSRGPYCYRIQGMNYHRMGSLLPDKGKPLMFSQLYIYDTKNEIKIKIKFISNGEGASSGKKKIDHQLITEIRDLLDTNNPLVAKFGWLVSVLSKKNQNNVRLRLIGTRERDGRKYNLPTAYEVAALIVGDFHSTEHKRDIILEEQGGDLQ
ncbi:putative PIF1 DNA helicase/replication protein A1-like protein [Tanacetum coccineum]